MARTRKTSTGDEVVKATRTRKPRKAAEPTQQQVTRSPGEQALCDRYPDHNIKPGSLLFADHPDNPFRGKRVVTLICPACSAERVLCTSDLFHVRHCVGCAKNIKANKKAKAKNEKKPDEKKD